MPNNLPFKNLPNEIHVFGVFTDYFINQVINAFKNIILTAQGRLEKIIKMIKEGKNMEKREKIALALQAMYDIIVLAFEIDRIRDNANDINKIRAGLAKLIIDAELPLGFYFAFGELRPHGVTDFLVKNLYGATIKQGDIKDDKNPLEKLNVENMITDSFDKITEIKLKNRMLEPSVKTENLDINKTASKVTQSPLMDKVKKETPLSKFKEKAKKYIEKEFLKKSEVDTTRDVTAYIKNILNSKPLGFGSKTKYIYFKPNNEDDDGGERIENMSMNSYFERDKYISKEQRFLFAGQTPYIDKNVIKMASLKNISYVTEVKNEGQNSSTFLISRAYVTQSPFVFFFNHLLYGPSSMNRAFIDDAILDATIDPLEDLFWNSVVLSGGNTIFDDSSGVKKDNIGELRKYFVDYYKKYGNEEARTYAQLIYDYTLSYYPNIFVLLTILMGEANAENLVSVETEYYADLFEKSGLVSDRSEFIKFLQPVTYDGSENIRNLPSHASDEAFRISSEILQRLFLKIDQYSLQDISFLSRMYEASGFVSNLKGAILSDKSENNPFAEVANNIRVIISSIAEKYLALNEATYSFLSKSNMNAPNFVVASLEPFSKYLDELPAVYPVVVPLPQKEGGRVVYKNEVFYIYKDFLPLKTLQISRKDIKVDSVELPGNFSFEIPAGWDAFHFSGVEIEIFETGDRHLTRYFREYFRRAFFRSIARPVFEISFILDIIVMNNQFEVDDILSLIVVPTTLGELFNIYYDAEEHIKEQQPLKLSFSVIGFIDYGRTMSSVMQGGQSFGLDYATGAAAFPAIDIKSVLGDNFSISSPNFYVDYLNGKISKDLANKLQIALDAMLAGWYYTHTTGPWTGDYYLLTRREQQLGAQTSGQNRVPPYALSEKAYTEYTKILVNNEERKKEIRPINFFSGPFSHNYLIKKS